MFVAYSTTKIYNNVMKRKKMFQEANLKLEKLDDPYMAKKGR